MRRTIQIDRHDKLIVYPRLGRLTPRWSDMFRETFLGNRRAQHRQGITDGEFYALRDWRAGDSRQWIHWRTSARRGNLMVRQFELNRTQDLTLLVELWQPEDADPRHDDDVERVVSFAATAATQICRRGGSHLRLAVAGRELTVSKGPASAPLLRDVLQHLAVAEATAHPNYSKLRALAADRRRTDAVMLVTTRPAGSAINGFGATGTQSAVAVGSRVLTIHATELAEYFHMDD
jgi:uncharacterized protein (DUF58 family)